MNIVVWIKSSQKEIFTPHYHKGASYLALLDTLARRGHRVFLAYDAASLCGDDTFLVNSGIERVRADVVYNLGNIPETADGLPHARITNTPAFRKFFASKFAVYEYLQMFFPKTIQVTREEDFSEALKKIPDDTIVFKPNTGTNGRGVRVLKKNEAALDEEMRAIIAEPGGALLQEFIDTSKGIAGICSSYHDLRLATVNNAIALTHVRIPEPGSLVANYAQGATIHELAAADIPKHIINFYQKVQEKIAMQFPNAMYTMDIGVGASGEPILFEINGTTAFPWPEFKSKDFFITQLALHLEKKARR
jgi:glutathione synthase/RimK-type ligase-like ATP-grasp enzyme